MEFGEFDVAKRFIIYRATKTKEREIEKEKVEKKLESNTLKIIKSS
jgi:hypothetical protein